MPWTRLADPPTGWGSSWYSDGAIAFTAADGRIYVFDPFGGQTLIRYTPAANTWAALPNLNPPAFIDNLFAAGEYAGTIYFLGEGYRSGSPIYVLLSYDETTGVLTDDPHFALNMLTGGDTGSGYAVRYPAMSARSGSRLWGSIVQFGTNYGAYLVGYDFESLDWYSARISHEQFEDATLAADSSSLYVAGGFFYPGGDAYGEPNNSVDWIRRVDPDTGAVSIIAHDPVGNFNDAAAVVQAGKLWLIGGWNGARNKIVRTFDLTTSVWTTLEDFPEIMDAGVAAVSDGKIYSGLGWNGSGEAGWYVLETAHAALHELPDFSSIAEGRAVGRLNPAIQMRPGGS